MLFKNRIHKLVFTAYLLFGLMLISCTKDAKEPNKKIDYNDLAELSKFGSKVAGKEFRFATFENFNSDTLKEIVIGKEIEEGDTWGIRFSFYETEQSVHTVYTTMLLEGSFSGATVTPMKIAGRENQLLYYNSGDFFLGSGGGEIYSYIIDLENKKVHAAKLRLQRLGDASLQIITDGFEETIKEYFITLFKKEYPDLTVTESDSDEKNE